mmetsp:Transcript_4821/g.4263  ORF Transcript_4821/g.4263 Transcript_4821/m.4263 type:complete len:293 (+) Transcript_4821:160-1038(+)
MDTFLCDTAHSYLHDSSCRIDARHLVGCGALSCLQLYLEALAIHLHAIHSLHSSLSRDGVVIAHKTEALAGTGCAVLVDGGRHDGPKWRKAEANVVIAPSGWHMVDEEVAALGPSLGVAAAAAAAAAHATEPSTHTHHAHHHRVDAHLLHHGHLHGIIASATSRRALGLLELDLEVLAVNFMSVHGLDGLLCCDGVVKAHKTEALAGPRITVLVDGTRHHGAELAEIGLDIIVHPRVGAVINEQVAAGRSVRRITCTSTTAIADVPLGFLGLHLEVLALNLVAVHGGDRAVS